MINPIGNPNIIPSILSSKPPCPGNIWPVSFIFDFLLRYENNKSPIWTKKEIIIPINRINANLATLATARFEVMYYLMIGGK